MVLADGGRGVADGAAWRADWSLRGTLRSLPNDEQLNGPTQWTSCRLPTQWTAPTQWTDGGGARRRTGGDEVVAAAHIRCPADISDAIAMREGGGLGRFLRGCAAAVAAGRERAGRMGYSARISRRGAGSWGWGEGRGACACYACVQGGTRVARGALTCCHSQLPGEGRARRNARRTPPPAPSGRGTPRSTREGRRRRRSRPRASGPGGAKRGASGEAG